MRISLILSLLFSFVSANEKFLFLTKSLESENNFENFRSDSNSTLIGSKYYISSEGVSYDSNSKKFNFCSGVSAIQNQNLFVLSDEININATQDDANFSSLFLYNTLDNLWLSVKDGEMKRDKYTLSNAITSSCEIDDATWSIGFEKGIYNIKDNWVSLYHPRFYIYDVPILYFPYFAFSTNKERSSGFLRPDFGLSADEGFYYLQPLFINLDESADIELNGQIRTSRGSGLYSTLRFKDSKDSYGALSVGYFKERDSYKDKFKLKHDSHYGVEAFYEKNSFLSKYFDVEDGLYLDSIWLNDIDYLNLKETINHDDSTTNIITSKLNYFLKDDSNNYYGLYSKYFIDTAKNSNKDTFQNLPTLNYHKFFDSYDLGFLTLFSSMDFKAREHYREHNVTASQQELLIPLSIYISLFDDFVTLKLSESIYATNINYSDKHLDSGLYFNNYHTISLTSELLKPYSNFLHTVLLDTTLNIPSYRKQESDILDFIPINEEQEKSLVFEMVQSFYNLNREHIFTHRLKQGVYFDEHDKYGNLENEILYTINSKLKFYNDLFYSHEENKIVANTFTIDYDVDRYDLSLSHFFEDSKDKKSSFLIFDTNKQFSKNYLSFASLKYDFEDSFLKSWEVGLKMNKKCWDYKISYKEELNPISTVDGSSSIKNKIIYFQINLIPLGGVRQKIQRQSRG